MRATRTKDGAGIEVGDGGEAQAKDLEVKREDARRSAGQNALRSRLDRPLEGVRIFPGGPTNPPIHHLQGKGLGGKERSRGRITQGGTSLRTKELSNVPSRSCSTGGSKAEGSHGL